MHTISLNCNTWMIRKDVVSQIIVFTYEKYSPFDAEYFIKKFWNIVGKSSKVLV